VGKFKRTIAVLALLLLSAFALGVTPLSAAAATNQVHGHWSPGG
jgi:hypothetical protein